MTEATTASPALVPFTERHEGRVHKAYRDSGGVITIGIGFTNLSQVFAAAWLKLRGHKLRMGDTITDGECDALLGKLIAEDYAPPVARRFAATGIRQHEFDAATDLCFNCGAGALKWTWATALARRAVGEAAAHVRVTAVTAGGRRLAGLERRRADEARLMETGDYRQPTAGDRRPEEDVAAVPAAARHARPLWRGDRRHRRPRHAQRCARLPDGARARRRRHCRAGNTVDARPRRRS